MMFSLEYSKFTTGYSLILIGYRLHQVTNIMYTSVTNTTKQFHGLIHHFPVALMQVKSLKTSWAMYLPVEGESIS
jgi:hypothetical protein